MEIYTNIRAALSEWSRTDIRTVLCIASVGTEQQEIRYRIDHESVDPAEDMHTFLIFDLSAGYHHVVADGYFVFGEDKADTEVHFGWISRNVDRIEIKALAENFFQELWEQDGQPQQS